MIAVGDCVVVDYVGPAAREAIGAEDAFVRIFAGGRIGEFAAAGGAKFFAAADVDVGVEPLFCCVDIEAVDFVAGGVCLRGLRLQIQLRRRCLGGLWPSECGRSEC